MGHNGSGGLVIGGGIAALENTIVAGNTGTLDPDVGGSGAALRLQGANFIGRNTGPYAGVEETSISIIVDNK